MVMFCKEQNVKKIGEVILGFGILFMGLSIMGDSMKAVKDSPQILGFLSSLTNPVAAILTGLVITAVLQSSSATVGIILLMVSQGLLEFAICPFMILGCNMGACVSALVASLGGNKDAKRAALIHFLFNVVGSAIMLVILLIALRPFTDMMLHISGGDLARAVANVHSLMKIFEVAMLFPFMGWIVKATYKIVPGEDQTQEDAYELLFIGSGRILSSTTAVLDGIREIVHMGKVASMNLQDAMEVLCNPDEEKIEEVYKREAYIDFMSRKITDYLVRANALVLPLADERLIGGLFHVVNDIERIGDHAENFADSAKARIEHGVEFSEKALRQLKEMNEKTVKILEYSLETFRNRNYEHMREILQLEDEIDAMEKKLQNAHVKRLTKNKCTPEAGMMFSDTVSGLERVGDHATNIAFAILEPEPAVTVEDDDDE